MAQDTANSSARVLKIVVLTILGIAIAAVLSAIALSSFTAFSFGKNSWQVAHSNKLHFGLGINTDVDADALGLPIYPGAKPYKDGDDEAGANIWAVAANAGLKVATKTFASADPPQKVVAFYRQALGKYGPVLACSGRDTDYEFDTDNSDRLTCDDGDSDDGKMELKVGTQHNQHIAVVRAQGETGGSIFTLVFIRVGQAD